MIIISIEVQYFNNFLNTLCIAQVLNINNTIKQVGTSEEYIEIEKASTIFIPKI